MQDNNVQSTPVRQEGARKSVSFAEMCKQVGYNHITVLVDSYGYVERTCISAHFEPFKRKRQFAFTLDWDEDYEGCFWLTHRWLTFEDECKEYFYQDENGEWHCDDPDLFARISYDD